jgi:(2Fe-2S) ferredoxin
VPRPEIQILVCTNNRGTNQERASCGARGALGLYRAVKDRLRERGLRERVLVTRTGCLRHCSRGSTVAVWPGNHWHGAVTPQDADDLIDAALAGERLERRKMPPGPLE